VSNNVDVTNKSDRQTDKQTQADDGMAGNWRPNGPSTECPVYIFTVRINSKSFPWTRHLCDVAL